MCDFLCTRSAEQPALAMPGLSTVLTTVRMNGLLSDLIVPSARIAECRMKANKSNGGENREEDEELGRDTRSGNRLARIEQIYA
jgi:hypothetical protein